MQPASHAIAGLCSGGNRRRPKKTRRMGGALVFLKGLYFCDTLTDQSAVGGTAADETKKISTRRFFWRFSSVVLGATGRYSP